MNCRECRPGRDNPQAFKTIIEALGLAKINSQPQSNGETPDPKRPGRPRKPKAQPDKHAIRISAKSFPTPTHQLERAEGLVNIFRRLNVRGNRSEIDVRPDPYYRHGFLLTETSGFVPATDELEAAVASVVRHWAYVGDGDEWKRFNPSDQDRKEAVLAILHRHREDPFHTFLERLPKWDEKPRIDGLLTQVFKAPDDPLTQWASRYPFIGAVQRAFVPGARIKEIPVLKGPQGVGKSPYLAHALPPEYRRDWFNDALNLSGDPRELAESLQGRVLVELAELTGIRRAEIEASNRSSQETWTEPEWSTGITSETTRDDV